uniref:Uncharacterized protein n=1 Tax=Nelumbo nucifera TaxID=4432 RepID=A0A822ZTW5_NELNU|nr:TPA_asm: hypothetical protein HUJ06_003548 [Nelumbo nucifera]
MAVKEKGTGELKCQKLDLDDQVQTELAMRFGGEPIQ